MSRFNNGLIYTNDSCIACNKCVTNCSTFGANVSLVENGKLTIQIDSEKCNNCGKCIDLCIRNARQYRDDFDLFQKDLARGEKISVILSPVFHLYYGEKLNNFIGFLKSIGVQKVYDETFGAEINIWAHTNYLKEHIAEESRAFISQTCPSLVNTIELHYPNLLHRIVPVHSPMMCTAIYAKKYLCDANKIAYIGTCVSKKDEINNPLTFGFVNYNVTFKKFCEHYDLQNMEKNNSNFDLNCFGFGKITNFSGGLSEIIESCFPPNYQTVKMIGFVPTNFQTLKLESENKYEGNMPLLTEISACNSCMHFKPSMNIEGIETSLINSRYSKLLREFKESSRQNTYEENFQKINSYFELLNKDDFTRKFQNRYIQEYNLPPEIINEIFASMRKDTVEKQNINCGCCGYSTCSKMAKAIAFGYTRKENCIHFMNDEMLLRIKRDLRTGLLSLPAFIEEYNKMALQNPEKEYFIIGADVNKFKVINELFGPKVGDKLLKMMGQKLYQIFGENLLAGHLGGGIFIMVMENTTENLQRLYSTKSFDFTSIGITYPVTMRFGLAKVDNNISEIVYYLDRALLAVDVNQNSIINTFTWYDNKYKSQFVHESKICSLMQDAIKNGEIQVSIQPQYNAKNEKIVSAEALSTWIRPDGSIISPGEFIPIAEKNKYIKNIDKMIWEKAFALQRRFLDDGITPVPIALNISRVSLEGEDCFYYIKHLLKEYNIPLNLIHFEITESAYSVNQSDIIQKVQSIRELGFKIALDDFGSGYSSLNSLKDLPVDILKFDMRFFKENVESNKNSNIIDLLLKLSKNLNLITIAEGVDSYENAEFLRKQGCDIFQGYLYSKSIPLEEFYTLIKKSEISKPIEKPSPKIYEKTPIGTMLLYFKADVSNIKESLKIKIEAVNGFILDFLGVDEAQILQWNEKNLFSYISTEDIIPFYERITQSLVCINLKSYEHVCTIKDKDNTFQKLKLMISPVRNEDNKSYRCVINFIRLE